MVDPGRLLALLDRLGDELVQLRRLAAMNDDELVADPEADPSVKYRLQVAIETSIDAAEHIIALTDMRVPATFADAFTVLGEREILSDPDLPSGSKDAARFRNLLVYRYAAIDDDRVREILRHRLDDLDTFRRRLAALV